MGVRPGWAEHLLVDQQIEHRIDRVRIVAPSYASILAAEFDDTEFDDTEFDDTEFDDTEFDDTEFDDTEFDDTEFDVVDATARATRSMPSAPRDTARGNVNLPHE